MAGVGISVFGSVFLVFNSVYNLFGFKNLTQTGWKIISDRVGLVSNLVRVHNLVWVRIVNLDSNTIWVTKMVWVINLSHVTNLAYNNH